MPINCGNKRTDRALLAHSRVSVILQDIYQKYHHCCIALFRPSTFSRMAELKSTCSFSNAPVLYIAIFFLAWTRTHIVSPEMYLTSPRQRPPIRIKRSASHHIEPFWEGLYTHSQCHTQPVIFCQFHLNQSMVVSIHIQYSVEE